MLQLKESSKSLKNISDRWMHPDFSISIMYNFMKKKADIIAKLPGNKRNRPFP